jgi:hypothetical protein
MPTNPVLFKESLMRRIVRAAHKEGMQISYVEVLPDRTVRIHTAPRHPLDLTNEIESLGLDEIRAHGEAAA